MGSDDPPGKQKHLRFEIPCQQKLQQLLQILLDFPGVKAIVRHEGGSKSGKFKEHPHYHVWYESEVAITNQTVRNWLKAIPAFLQLNIKKQTMWSFRNHDSMEIWAKYVISNSTYSVLLTHPVLQKTIEETPQTPVVVHKGDAIEHIGGDIVVVPARKSRSMRVQFIEWLEEHRKWLRCETITPENSHEMLSIINDELCDYWEMAFAFNQAIQMVNHAHWVFANPPERARIRSKFHSAILKSNYLV